MSPTTDEARHASLVAQAQAVQPNAYAPYSKFRVGAALITDTGEVYLGVNVENASYPVGVCAERSAITSAVTDGVKADSRAIVAIAIATDATMAVMPCGMCAQALFEFNPDMEVTSVGTDGVTKTLTMREILPYAYAGEGLE
ncbi:MAG: cytidine deaminase [Myxococcota bacterium]|jgi:cytidine deaminase